jgi:hypothetical protein
MTIGKAWIPSVGSGFSLASLFARLKSAVKFEVPTGYQDETGFHLGVKAPQPEIKWPATW